MTQCELRPQVTAYAAVSDLSTPRKLDYAPELEECCLGSSMKNTSLARA
jgi:hypothetical protein